MFKIVRKYKINYIIFSIIVMFLCITNVYAGGGDDDNSYGDYSKVNSSPCEYSTYPKCCRYRIDSDLVQDVSITINVSNGTITSLYANSYEEIGDDFKIKNWDSKISGQPTGKSYVASINKCPSQIGVHEWSSLGADGYDIYIGSESALKSFPHSYIIYEYVPNTQEEQEQLINGMSGYTDTLNKNFDLLNDNACLDEKTWDRQDPNFDYQKRSTCYDYYESIKNISFSAKSELDRLSSYHKIPADILNNSPIITALNDALATAQTYQTQLETFISTSYSNNNSSGTTIGSTDLSQKQNMNCESLKATKTYQIVKQIFKWMQIIAPIMLIIFGVIDFIKATAAGDNDAIKKAQSAFVKRVIVVAIIILLPFIMELLFTLLDGAFGNDISTCDLGK